eukprot:scaffold44743_cov810-Skeletonema_marinoi.AAC.1
MKNRGQSAWSPSPLPSRSVLSEYLTSRSVKHNIGKLRARGGAEDPGKLKEWTILGLGLNLKSS